MTAHKYILIAGCAALSPVPALADDNSATIEVTGAFERFDPLFHCPDHPYVDACVEFLQRLAEAKDRGAETVFTIGGVNGQWIVYADGTVEFVE